MTAVWKAGGLFPVVRLVRLGPTLKASYTGNIKPASDSEAGPEINVFYETLIWVASDIRVQELLGFYRIILFGTAADWCEGNHLRWR